MDMQEKKDPSGQALKPDSGRPEEVGGVDKGASGELDDSQLEGVAGGVRSRAMKWDGF